MPAFLQEIEDEVQLKTLIDDSIHTSKGSKTYLWTLTAPIHVAQPGQPAFRSVKLGLPKMHSRWFALVRMSRPWLAPRQGNHQFSLTEVAILASFLRHDGSHLVLLVISLDDILTVLKSDEWGNVIAFARNDRLVQGKIRVVAAVAPTFEAANEAVSNYARTV